jgi:hypothetical protein
MVRSSRVNYETDMAITSGLIPHTQTMRLKATDDATYDLKFLPPTDSSEESSSSAPSERTRFLLGRTPLKVVPFLGTELDLEGIPASLRLLRT